MSTAKTTCTTSRAYFTAEAKHLTVLLVNQLTTEQYTKLREVLGASLLCAEHCQPRQFESGSLGWNLSTKAVIPVGGDLPKCQVGMNVTLVGSKDLPK